MLGALVERLVHFVEPLYIDAGYLIVGFGVFFERSVFIGLIIPGDVILALGGVYASRGTLALPVVMTIGVTAAILGESTGYWLGRRYGRRLLRRLPFLNRFDDRIETAEAYFERRGGWTVALGRYATAAGAFIPFIAGMSRMPYGRFLMFDVPAVVIWAVGISIFGYEFGDHLAFIDKALSRFGYAVLGLLVVFFGARFLWKRWKARRADAHQP
jgi:membrane-associated protein